MALTDYVIMPSADYVAACDKVRERTGKADPIKSVDLATEIEAIPAGGGGMELNIAYGDTPPEDTTKLWVKTSQPSNITVQPNTSGSQIADAWNTDNSHNNDSVYGLCAAVGDSIYLFGGVGKTTTLNKAVQRFYKTNGAWYKQQSLDVWSGTMMGCCAPVGTLIYVFGGNTYKSYNWQPTSTIYTYDTVEKTMSTSSLTLPSTLRMACCASVGEKVYIFGGNTSGGNRTENILCVDTENQKIDVLEAKLTYQTQAACCSVVGSKIYIFGGNTYESGAVDTIYCFDTETQKIELLEQTLPEPICFSASASIGDRIYIFGGMNTSGESSMNVYVFNTKTRVITTSNITIAGSDSTTGGSAATSSAGTLYFKGGTYTTSGSLTTTSNKYYAELVASEDVPLSEGTLLIVTSETKNIFSVVKGAGMQVEVGVDSIFRGNAEGIGENVEADLYKDDAWTSI